jgi:DNA-binding Lrp family transcriptional regulator
MDRYDWKILAALQSDGRLTNQEIGNRIGLSASQCSRRRTALEQAGVISGYGARLNSRAIGLDVLAFIHVTLQAHDTKVVHALERLVDSHDEIQEAHLVSGDTDYLLKVVMESLERLADFVTKTLLVHEAIAHVKSHVVFRQMKQTNGLPTKQ